MENRRRYLIYMAFLALWIAISAGCTASKSPSEEKNSEGMETDGGTVCACGAAVVNGAAQAASPKKASTLNVTDHRTNSATVREYADKETFLREYGYDGKEPYFQYYTEKGELQLELYYSDYWNDVGCGLRYYPDEDWEPEGFLFNGSGNYRYYRDFMVNGGIETDRYSMSSFGGGDIDSGIEDYEESAMYLENGRPISYTSQGWITYLHDKKETEKILEIEWSYRDDGTLRERDYWHNSMVFGTWYSSRQSYYDAQERLVWEHCYVTHGSVDYYYIYEDESEVPEYCLIIDNNTNLMCAELLEYHDMKTGMYYGKIGPSLAGETENRYAEAVIEYVEKEGKNHDGYVTHTYAADYDGDFLEEAFVIFGTEIIDKYEQDIEGTCWFVDNDLNVSLCIGVQTFDMEQEFICQDGITYLLLGYSSGFRWQTQLYTVRDNVPVELSGSYENKFIDKQGNVIYIRNTYEGQCTLMDVGVAPDDDWRYLWTGHTWTYYTFIFDHGELREVPAKEVTREDVERIAPLPDSFDEIAADSVKQFILRDNGELNINMAVENEIDEYEKYIDFSYITDQRNEAGEWEDVEKEMG